MARRGWLAIIALIVLGGILGAGAIVVSVEVNRHTSTDAFCTSCHSMRHVAADPYFVKSKHRSNAEGVIAGCADCHIPKTNWFVETYAHVASGIRDILAEQMNNFADRPTWEKHRVALAHYVRDEMRRSDSVTCRGCHDAAAIRPASQGGQAAHALLAERRITCIDCHFNLIHAPVPPSADFLRGSGLRTQRK
jgi:nitrate/TMAO reductase-like tetraheme cytochrome c subunit